MPGRGIDLPELLTWTLGERSEFVPQLRRAPAAARRAAAAFAGRRAAADATRAVDAEIDAAMRLAQARRRRSRRQADVRR